MRTTAELVESQTNDYFEKDPPRGPTELRLATADPFLSSQEPSSSRTSVSVVIPSFQSLRTVVPCVNAIADSSFNMRWPDQLEVVVVDDGSTDGTFDHLANTEWGVNTTVLRQPHLGRAAAMNCGCSVSRGQIVVSCDADMILTACALDQLVKIHEWIWDSVSIGFRSDVQWSADRDVEYLAGGLPRFFDDNRYRFDQVGWPENMMASSKHLRELGHGKQFWMTDGATPYDHSWTLPRMVYGALFGMPRTLMAEIGGFDERFQGWGWEDTWLGARAVSKGSWVVPAPGATGYHLAHPDRSPTKWQEAERNKALYERLLHAPMTEVAVDWLDGAAKRIERRRDARGRPSRVNRMAVDRVHRDIDCFLADPCNAGKYYAALGQWGRACVMFQRGTPESAADAVSHAKCLFELGQVDQSIERLTEALETWRESAEIRLELMWHYFRIGEHGRARATLGEIVPSETGDDLTSYLKRHSADKHFHRGSLYLKQGMHGLAWRDFAAALLLDQSHDGAIRGLDLCT